MGGLKVLPVLLVPALVAAADPEPVTVLARVPGGARASVRLVFRKGVQVEAKALPASFKEAQAEASEGWLSYHDLTPAGRKWALLALWPDDQWGDEGVKHRVRWPQLESVWLMSSLWCGHGQNHDKLQEANPKREEVLRRGDLWTIPAKLLSTAFGGPVKGFLGTHFPEDDLDDEARTAAYRALLTYKAGHAEYRLRKGEALYSSVVIRYTDRTEPKDVNELALELARAAGVEDVRAIPPGTLIRIPLKHLAAPFQPEGAQALKEEREVQAEVRRTVRLTAGPKLQGVCVILDPGHGGIDPGAQANGVWESDHVYDIAMRVRRLLEANTEAQVSLTLRYPAVGFRERDTIAKPTREAVLLTSPPYANDAEASNATSVHLRWVLANDLVAAHRVKQDARKTLFISFHADSLHPSARGAMVYVPGAAGVPPSFHLGPSQGAGVRELKRGGTFTASNRERVQAEARSRIFAETFLRRLKQAGLPVHENRPIRNIIKRGAKSFVPAVIRQNMASTKVLLEVANLQNEEDAEDLKSPAFRQRFAEALVEAIRSHFGR